MRLRSWAALAAAALLLLSAAPALAQTPSPSPAPLDSATKAKIDRDVRAELQAAHAAAATIAIVEDGRIAYSAGYGMRDLARSLPADAQTRYEIGSITKQFTAAAIMQLREAGKIDLDAKLATYLPGAPHAGEITIRQLLTHTSGLHEYLDVVGAAQAGRPTTPEGILATIAAMPLDFAPGTKWAYSNTNYILLGRVIEAVSKEPYERYVREHLLAPAGMTQTATIAQESTLPDMAHGYVYRKGAIVPAPPLASSWAWSAGDLVSTVADLQRWNAALASGKIVSPQDYTLMSTPQAPTGRPNAGYGFGLMVDTFEGQPRIWHNGGTFGFDTSDQLFPAQHVNVIVFTNAAGGSSGQIATRLYNDLFPSLAAAEQLPASGEDPAVTARIKAFVIPLLQGKPDRSQITDASNKALTPEMIQSVAQQLAPLGTPAFVYKGVVERPDGPVYSYLLKYPQAVLKLTIQIDKASNKFSVFYVSPE